LIAIGGLAKLRTAELLRVDWADVWRGPKHIERTAGKSKTRPRCLLEICFQEHFNKFCEAAKVTRKANGF
jgi:hypothetical protein